MSDPAMPEQPSPRITVLQFLLLAVGVILLAPGACSVVVLIQMISDNPTGWYKDPYIEAVYFVWAVSALISLAGAVLLWFAIRKIRAARLQESPPA